MSVATQYAYSIGILKEHKIAEAIVDAIRSEDPFLLAQCSAFEDLFYSIGETGREGVVFRFRGRGNSRGYVYIAVGEGATVDNLGDCDMQLHAERFGGENIRFELIASAKRRPLTDIVDALNTISRLNLNEVEGNGEVEGLSHIHALELSLSSRLEMRKGQGQYNRSKQRTITNNLK